MKINQSDNINLNYAAKIVELQNGRKHSNADRLKVFTIDFQNVITDLSYNDGDIVVYFPVECSINADFISFIDGFIDPQMNRDKTKCGFFNKYSRVRAIALRSEKSQGFIIKLSILEDFLGIKVDYELDKDFDRVGDVLICQKYVNPNVRAPREGKNQQKKERVSRVVDNQFKFHIDTSNLRRNIHKIQPNDLIGISYKVHGTSMISANVLVKKELKWYEKLAKKLGLNVVDTEYDVLYSSRKVLKNAILGKESQHFYDSDIWKDATDTIKDRIPKGFSIYSEVGGYTKNSSYIQRPYDYGCKGGEFKVYVYRITSTNVDGFTIELDDFQIKQFCEKYDLNYLNTKFYYGYAKDLYPELDVNNHWHENFITNLERDYNNKDCFMCINKVPCEGIVLRKADLFEFEAFKLKSSDFLEFETKQLDDENLEVME